MKMKLDRQRLLDELERQGWRIRMGSKHLVLYPADRTKPCFTVSMSPSDRQAENQFQRDLRRSGYVRERT